MERLNIILDEETSNLLEGKKNKSRHIREALKVYNQCITLDTFSKLCVMVERIGIRQKDMDEKLDYLATRLEKND